MIYRIKNRYLRGLMGWILIAAAIVAFPVLVLISGTGGLYYFLRDEWKWSRPEWLHVLSFKRGTP